jgi:hypothetical protein
MMGRVCNSAKEEKMMEGRSTMRKIIFILAALMFAAPATADVTITCDPCGLEATVKFTEDETGRVRALGLDITVDSGAVITGVSGYKTGESKVGDLGYGIFPANFARYIDANDPNWDNPDYTPVADGGDNCAQSGPGTSGITIELGSLYVDEGNAPLDDGPVELLTFTVDKECDVTITENDCRGGVVMEDPDQQVVVNLSGCHLASPDCFFVGKVDICGWTVTQDDVNEWVLQGKPSSWCWPCHCLGDMDRSCTINTTDLLGTDPITPTDGWKRAFAGTYDPNCDTNYDGSVNTTDLLGRDPITPADGWKLGFGMGVCPQPCP